MGEDVRERVKERYAGAALTVLEEAGTASCCGSAGERGLDSEALGVDCKVGIATRPVRVVILAIGLLFAEGELISDVNLLPAAIYAMVALTAFTVGQRVWHVRAQLNALDRQV